MVADAKQIVCTYKRVSILCLADPPTGRSTPNDPITCPFMVWGLAVVGPLKRVPRGYTHLLVTIDKFTKWIEARPIPLIKSEQAMLFFLDIICFWVPNSITDNGT